MTDAFVHGYALLVGVGLSVCSSWSLPVTVKDAQALRAVLTHPDLCGYPDDDQHVRLLHDAGATKDAILEGLRWLRDQATADAAATVVVFFSGHGWLNQSSGEYYLIPHDVDPSDVSGSALPATTFIPALRAIRARRLLVFIDSCHAEGMATAKSPSVPGGPSGYSPAAAPKALTDALIQGEGRAVFTSSRGNQLSWVRADGAMSIYTYHLIEALTGASNRPGDVTVNVSDLMNYLAKTVPQSVAELCPSLPPAARAKCELGQVPFFDCAAEDFPVALLQGGKGLPPGGWLPGQHAPGSFMRPSMTFNVDQRRGGVYFDGQTRVEIHGDVVGRSQKKQHR